MNFLLNVLRLLLAGLRTDRATPPLRLGAYYFDGWAGLTPGHPTPDRAQIDSAAAGLSFFSFCWSFPEQTTDGFRTSPLTRALGFYLKAPNRHRLRFSLVANHAGFVVAPRQGSAASREWLSLFRPPSYLRASHRPLLTFFRCRHW